MSFWKELKRRNVYKVGVAYVIVAWLLIQAASIIFPHLNLSTWAVTFLIVFLIIGFPLVLIFAWAFEITPTGLKWTKHVPRHESITHLTGKKLNYVLVGVIVVAVAYILFDNYYLDRRAIWPEMVSNETPEVSDISDIEKAQKTIAVRPFVNLSSDPEQEYFVEGLSEELLNSLTKIPNVSVVARTSSFIFKGSDKKVQEIANELGVDHILEGSVRKVGNSLRISAQLIRAADGFHLWSETYDRELKDIFAVQEDIATTVADEFKVTFGIDKSFRQLGGTENAEAYEFYLIAKGLWISAQGGDFSVLSRALESIDAAIAIDPEFALAWTTKVNFHNIMGEQDEALRAALKAIELEPNLAEAYASLGGSRMVRGEWIDAELAFRKARELTTEPISGNPYPDLLLAVAHFERALEKIEEQLLINPVNIVMRGEYFTDLFFLGQIQRAEEEYVRGKTMFGDQWMNWQLIKILFAVEDYVSLDGILPFLPIDNEAKKRIESPEEALEELRQLYTDGDNLSTLQFIDIFTWAAYFGDPEFAMNVIEKRPNIGPDSLVTIWYPVMKEVRQLPRFKELVREIGLVDY